MRGVGGPLLCIGDLLCDVGESDDDQLERPNPQIQIQSPTSPSSFPSSSDIHPSRITQLFQEDYEQLNKALAGADHSWTCLTLKLCTSLDTAKKLIESANSNVTLLSENVGQLETMIKKGDSAIAEVRSIHSSLSQRIVPSTEGEA